MRFLTLDTETTGVKPGTDRLIELSAQLWEGDKLIQDFYLVVNPGVPIPAEASAVNGWTDERVAGRPLLDAIMGMELLDFLRDGDGPIYVHNLAFDLALLVGDFGRFDPELAEELKTLPWGCTLRMAREIWPGADNKLAGVAERLQVQADGTLHSAEVDAGLLARMVPEIVHRYAVKGSNGALVKAAQPAGELVGGEDLLVDAAKRAGKLAERVANAGRWAAEYSCGDDEAEGDGHEALGQVKKLAADADAERKAVVEPIKAISSKIDQLFREQVSKPAEAARSAIERELARYAADKLRRQREAEAEARRKLEAERQRMAEAAAAGNDAATVAAQGAVVEAVAEVVAAGELGPSTVKAGSATGGYKTRWTARIVDPSKVPDVYWRPSLDLVQQAVEQGARAIPGCEVTEEVIVANRRRG